MSGWQRAMQDAVTDPQLLLDMLDVPQCERPAHLAAATSAATSAFGMRVPHAYIRRMRRRDIRDPLLAQVLPRRAENEAEDGFVFDAVGDMSSSAGHGLLHKYHGRALLVTTGACAIHCRYCFRRHFDYGAQHAGGSHTAAALDLIAADASLREVILSGGDPLSLSNARLETFGQALDAIPHVATIRLHTRTAVVLPERIDRGLIDWVARRRARVVVVIHANHANELDDDVAAALADLRRAGAALLNQAVLLKAVNDDADTLETLSRRLFDVDVMPYYLHMLDRVAGTHHFEVEMQRAAALLSELAARLPGYLVPRFARELPGGDAKLWLGTLAADTTLPIR